MFKGLNTAARVFNLAAPGANTNIITSFTPAEDCALKVTVCLSTSSVFNVTMTGGGTTHTMALNDGTALDANELYTFTVGAMVEDQSANTLTYNFQVATDSVIECLFVQEAQLGTTG